MADSNQSLQNAAAQSSRIDQELRRDYASREAIVLLLLGPPNSGKSTIVRQMRLLFDNESFTKEREAFRLAIYLSLIRTTRALLGLLERHASRQSSANVPTKPRHAGSSNGAVGQASSASHSIAALRREVSLKRLRLAPLLDIEESLRKHLGFTEQKNVTADEVISGVIEDAETAGLKGTMPADLEPEAYNFLPSKWRERASVPFLASGYASNPDQSAGNSEDALVRNPGDPSHILESSKEEITALFASCSTHGLLLDDDEEGSTGSARLSESARYFLDNLDRVTRSMPTDEDIMHLRLRTVGAEEHRIVIDDSRYLVVDVAGAHGTKPVWASFFEGARAIIFMVSLASYDEPPIGEKRLSPLDSALQTFGQICSNRLLWASDVILFLNKIDILRRKLKSSRSRLPTEACPGFPGPNEFKPFCSWIRNRFLTKHSKASPADRFLYSFFTQAVNCELSSTTISAVSDIIVRRNLSAAGLV